MQIVGQGDYEDCHLIIIESLKNKDVVGVFKCEDECNAAMDAVQKAIDFVLKETGNK
jgi:hypothetical protein